MSQTNKIKIYNIIYFFYKYICFISNFFSIRYNDIKIVFLF